MVSSVSYTHLDVYKRQDVPISPNKKIIYLAALVLGFGIPVAIIYIPVSYTHLDVYKRQVYEKYYSLI